MNTLKRLPGAWIVLSVFYSSEGRMHLLAGVLRDFLFARQAEGNIDAVYLAFSAIQGDHVRLALNCQETKREALFFELNHLLMQYLDKNPLATTGRVYEGKAFFMDFPENTVWENQFLPPLRPEYLELQLLLSKRMLQVFSTEASDDASIISFALYVLLVFYTVKQQEDPEALRNRLTVLLNIRDGKPDKDDPLFETYAELFHENSALILDIYREVTALQGPDDGMMGLWEFKCAYEQYLNAADRTDEGHFIPLDRVLICQLCGDYGLLPYLYYLIYLCLEVSAAPSRTFA